MRSCRIWIVSTVLALACGGGGGGGPTGNGGGASLVGTYVGSHIINIVGLIQITCGGSVTVTSHSGSSFSGTVRVDACEALALEAQSSSMSGTQGAGSAVEMTVAEISAQLDEIDDALEAQGCTRDSGDGIFRGTFSSQRIDVNTAFRFNCPEDLGGTIELQWRIDASRS